MKRRLLSFLICPACKKSLNLEVASEDQGEILEGELSCRPCQSRFPIRKGVPRFVQLDEYVDTFSFEWTLFHDVQIDILNATNESKKTFQGKTGWSSSNLKGKRVLDVRVGAGRTRSSVPASSGKRSIGGAFHAFSASGSSASSST